MAGSGERVNGAADLLLLHVSGGQRKLRVARASDTQSGTQLNISFEDAAAKPKPLLHLISSCVQAKYETVTSKCRTHSQARTPWIRHSEERKQSNTDTVGKQGGDATVFETSNPLS